MLEQKDPSAFTVQKVASGLNYAFTSICLPPFRVELFLLLSPVASRLVLLGRTRDEKIKESFN